MPEYPVVLSHSKRPVYAMLPPSGQGIVIPALSSGADNAYLVNHEYNDRQSDHQPSARPGNFDLQSKFVPAGDQ